MKNISSFNAKDIRKQFNLTTTEYKREYNKARWRAKSAENYFGLKTPVDAKALLVADQLRKSGQDIPVRFESYLNVPSAYRSTTSPKISTELRNTYATTGGGSKDEYNKTFVDLILGSYGKIGQVKEVREFAIDLAKKNKYMSKDEFIKEISYYIKVDKLLTPKKESARGDEVYDFEYFS